MEVRDSGIERMLRLRDGDSERGSGIHGETRTGLGGTRMRREIEHKALLPQVQALYTRATYYLVGNYKAISHQTSVSVSLRLSVSDKGTASARRSNQE